MIKENTIYLDFQASTPVRPEVMAAMQPYFSELYGNPHANDHIKGWEANKAVENSRFKIARAIGADEDEIVFTSGATEANNMALKGLEKYLQAIGRDTILVSTIEHKCILESAAYMKERGFQVTHVRPNSDGIVTIDALEHAMTDRVGLVSVMLVNNEIGTVQPVQELAQITHKHGALFHTDAAQAPVFMALDMDELGVDFMSLSSHKAYGPKGIGALYIRRDLKDKLQPLMHGGGQEDGLRSGTLPTALCIGMAAALELCAAENETNAQKLGKLSHQFWQQLKGSIPEAILNGSHTLRHPGNLNILFPRIKASHFLQSLQPNIAASTGSACNSGIENPSYVLAEIGLDLQEASACIRFSFGINQTPEQIGNAATIICRVYKEQSADPFAA
ncbi:MAG: cysteine desulfurase family protein [Micavibrio sp.]